jgi:hypothetical protein
MNGNGATIRRSFAGRAAVPSSSWKSGTYIRTAARTSSKAMPQSRRRLLKTPIERSEARSVRAAKAVPIWATTIERKVIVVACW